MGARKMDRTTSSSSSSPSFRRPTWSVCDACFNKSFEGNKSFTISTARLPLRRITAMAPMPGAVAGAIMVSSQPVSLLNIMEIDCFVHRPPKPSASLKLRLMRAKVGPPTLKLRRAMRCDVIYTNKKGLSKFRHNANFNSPQEVPFRQP